MIKLRLEGINFVLEIEAEEKPAARADEDTSESVGRNYGLWFGQGRITHRSGGDKQAIFLLTVKNERISHRSKDKSPYKDGVFTDDEDRTRQQLLQSLFRVVGWTDEHEVLKQERLNDVFVYALLRELHMDMFKPIAYPFRWLRAALYSNEGELDRNGIIRIPTIDGARIGEGY